MTSVAIGQWLHALENVKQLFLETLMNPRAARNVRIAIRVNKKYLLKIPEREKNVTNLWFQSTKANDHARLICI